MSRIGGGQTHAANFSERPEEAFIRLSQLFCAHLSREGIEARGYRDPGLPYFSALSSEGKGKVLSDIQGTLLIFDEMNAAGESLRDSARLLWRALSKIGLTPCSNAFAGISDGDIVEVYGLDFVQIFRNIEFFRVISMTLEELSCLPWTDTIQTEDTSVFIYYQKVIENILNGTLTQGFRVEGLAYNGHEKLGEHHRFRITMKWLAPVSSGGQMCGVIAVNHTEVLS